METILETLLTNKILMVVAILLVALIIYSILKRLVKVIVIILIGLVIYVGFMSYRGEKMDDDVQKILNIGGKEIKELQKKKEKISGALDTVEKISK